MQKQQFANPFYIFFLVLPAGISSGFVSVALPYLLRHKGFSVAETSAIVAIGVLANVLRFLWGPIADLTLSLRKWFWIGLASATITLLILCFVPFTTKEIVPLTIIVFISQIAGTLVMLPVGGFMATRIEQHHKGRAGGWFQAGNLGGAGLGGGLGLWLASDYSIVLAGIVLGMVCILSGLVVLLIKDVQHNSEKQFVPEIKAIGKELLSMLAVPIVLFVTILLLLPIGTGAASNVWSSIADDWKADAHTVALVTGALNGGISIIGCVLGGYIADRWGNWVAYFGSGAVCAFVAAVMAVSPHTPAVYIGGVLGYAFALGLINAAFSSVILYAIGKKNASTKYSLLSSLGNIPVAYMTSYEGWAHDKYNSEYMLMAEAIIGVFFIVICMIVLKRMKQKSLVLTTID